MFLPPQNYALALLSAGLGRIIPAAASKLPWFEEYKTAELAAKQGQLKMWEGWSPEQEQVPVAAEEEEEAEPEAAPSQAPAPRKDSIAIEVTELIDAGCFFAQVVGPQKDELNALMQHIADMRLDGTKPDFAPTPGAVCLGKFSEDGRWYRVRVMAPGAAADSFKVQYVDFGNVRSRSLSPSPSHCEY